MRAFGLFELGCAFRFNNRSFFGLRNGSATNTQKNGSREQTLHLRFCSLSGRVR
jgi:hypothetical protein